MKQRARDVGCQGGMKMSSSGSCYRHRRLKVPSGTSISCSRVEECRCRGWWLAVQICRHAVQQVPDSAQLARVLVEDGDGELVLQGHDDLDAVETGRPEIVVDAGSVDDPLGID